MKSNQTKPSQTKPNQIKSNETKQNQTKWNQTKPNQTKSNQIKSNQIKLKQNKTNQTNSNQTEAIWKWGCQPCVIQDGTAPNLTIFTQNVFKFVHVIIKEKPLPQIYAMHLGKSHTFPSAKYGVWVHEPCVLVTLPCMLIKHNDMVYCNKYFMSEK